MDQWAIDRETHGPAQLHERSVTLSSRLPKTLLCLHGIGNPPAERAVKELPYWLPVAEFERLIAQIKDDKISNTGPRQLPARTDPRYPAPDNDCGVLLAVWRRDKCFRNWLSYQMSNPTRLADNFTRDIKG